jgi:hypothetical protein
MSRPVYVVNKDRVEGGIDDIQGGINIFKDGSIVAAEVSQLDISTNMNATIVDDKVVLTATGGGGGGSYSHAISWDGASSPYTYEVTAATHGLGATKDLDITVFESDTVVGVDIDITNTGTVTITSMVNFSNGKIVIKI